jgi:hypothetical protein
MSLYWSYFYSLIIIIGLELSIINPNTFYLTAALTLFFNILFVWLSTRRRIDVNFFNFLISPLLFVLSGLLFLGFSGSWIIKELVIIFLVAANNIFLKTLIIHSHHKHLYKEHSLSTISRVINLSTIFLFFGGIFNLYAFLKINLWLLALAGALIAGLTIYQFFCISKIKNPETFLFIIINTLVMMEIFYFINWLPLLSPAKTLLLTSVYYFITSLSRYYHEGLLAKTVYVRYSLITGVIWVITLLTARWT